MRGGLAAGQWDSARSSSMCFLWLFFFVCVCVRWFFEFESFSSAPLMPNVSATLSVGLCSVLKKNGPVKPIEPTHTHSPTLHPNRDDSITFFCESVCAPILRILFGFQRPFDGLRVQQSIKRFVPSLERKWERMRGPTTGRPLVPFGSPLVDPFNRHFVLHL